MWEQCKELYNRIRKRISYRHVIGVALFLYTLIPLWVVSVKQEHLLVAVLVQCILFGVAWQMKDFRMLKPNGVFEYIAYGIGGLGIFGILLYCFDLDIGHQEGYDAELCMLLFTLIYLTVKCRPELEKWYSDVILAGLVVLQTVCLIYYLVVPEMGGKLGAFVKDKESVAVSAVLALLIAGTRYAHAREKQKQVLYGVSAAIAAFVLAVNHDVLSLYIVAALLLVVVAFCEPKTEVIKRNLQVLGGYLFLLCNMSLATEYTKWIQIECTGYSLESSVIAEMFLCAFLCYVVHVWDKLPKRDKDARISVLRRLQKCLRMLLMVLGCVVAGVLLTGDRLGQLPDGMIWKGIEAEGIILYQAVQGVAESNVLYQSVGFYGALGLALVALLLTAAVERIRKRHKPVLSERRMIKVLAIAILVLWGIRMQGMTVYGVCLWILSYALVPGLKFKNEKRSNGKIGEKKRT